MQRIRQLVSELVQQGSSETDALASVLQELRIDPLQQLCETTSAYLNSSDGGKRRSMSMLAEDVTGLLEQVMGERRVAADTVASGGAAPDAAVDDITELISQALVERRGLRANKPMGPPTTAEQAVYEDTLRGVYFHADQTDYVETFTGCSVRVVSTTATSGNADAGSLVLSRRRPDADEGLWVLDLLLFRESHP